MKRNLQRADASVYAVETEEAHSGLLASDILQSSPLIIHLFSCSVLRVAHFLHALFGFPEHLLFVGKVQVNLRHPGFTSEVQATFSADFLKCSDQNPCKAQLIHGTCHLDNAVRS